MTKSPSFAVRCLVSVALAGALGACSTPAAQAPLAASPASPAPAKASGELSELGSFVDRGVPSGVMIWLRVPAPGRDIPLLTTLTGVGAMLDPIDVLTPRLGPVLTQSVDLSKPVDVTIAGLDADEGQLVIATGIFDPDTFLGQVRRDFQVEHQSRGRWRLVPKANTDRHEFACELWRAAEPIGARLLCATQASLLEQQGEFLMARARTSVDRVNFHAELPGSAAQALLDKSARQEAHKQEASTEDHGARAGRELGHQLVVDWARDLSGLSWDLTLRRDSVDVSQTIGFLRQDSLFSTSLSGRAGAPKPVPDAFWLLPNDSDGALYSEGAEPEPMRKHAASLVHALRTAMEADDEDEFPPILLDRLEQSLRSLLLRGGAFEVAYGRDLDRATQALNEAADHASDHGPRSGSADPALIKAQAKLGGWALLGIEDDSSAYLQALREALRFAADKTKYPHKKGAKPPAPSASIHDFRELPLPASAGLPPAALHVLVSAEPNPKYVASKAKPAAPAASAYHVLAVPDSAQHLWLAISPDEALALARLHAVLAPGPAPAQTLGASEELRGLAKEPLAGIGFGTLAGLTALSLSAESKSDLLDSRRSLKRLWALPKRGATRMPIWITRAQPATGQRRVALNLRLTPDAIGDVIATFLARVSDPAVVTGE